MLLAAVVTATILVQMPIRITRAAIDENGPIENATVALYVVTGVIALIFARKKHWRHGYAVATILALAAMRELDFNDRFTTKQIDKLDFYLSPRVPLSEKLIVLAVLLAIGVFLSAFIRRAWPAFARALTDRQPYAISTTFAILLIVVSQVLDELSVPLKKSGFRDVALVAQVFEEILELGIPTLFLIALLQWAKGREACEGEIRNDRHRAE